MSISAAARLDVGFSQTKNTTGLSLSLSLSLSLPGRLPCVACYRAAIAVCRLGRPPFSKFVFVDFFSPSPCRLLDPEKRCWPNFSMPTLLYFNCLIRNVWSCFCGKIHAATLNFISFYIWKVPFPRSLEKDSFLKVISLSLLLGRKHSKVKRKRAKFGKLKPPTDGEAFSTQISS